MNNAITKATENRFLAEIDLAIENRDLHNDTIDDSAFGPPVVLQISEVFAVEYLIRKLNKARIDNLSLEFWCSAIEYLNNLSQAKYLENITLAFMVYEDISVSFKKFISEAKQIKVLSIFTRFEKTICDEIYMALARTENINELCITNFTRQKSLGKTILETFSKNISIQALTLCHKELESEDCVILLKNINLRKFGLINIDFPVFDQHAFNQICHHPNLQFLSLQVRFAIEIDLTNFKFATKLQRLILNQSYNQRYIFDSKVAQALLSLPLLNTLNINEAKITGEFLEIIATSNSLINLSIVRSGINKSIDVLIPNTTLKRLNLNHNEIGDDFARKILFENKTLMHLSLDGNNITDIGKLALMTNPNLKYLSVININIMTSNEIKEAVKQKNPITFLNLLAKKDEKLRKKASENFPSLLEICGFFIKNNDEVYAKLDEHDKSIILQDRKIFC